MWASSKLAKRTYGGGIIPYYPSIYINIYVVTRRRKRWVPTPFLPDIVRSAPGKQMPRDGQWPVLFSSWNIVNWSTAEQECSIPWLPVLLLLLLHFLSPTVNPAPFPLLLPLTHPASAFGDSPFVPSGWLGTALLCLCPIFGTLPRNSLVSSTSWCFQE